MPSKMAGNKGSTTPPPDAGSSTTRIQRNLAEKQRRDKLNGFISELATIVPMVSMASKRLDKTSILRLSAAHLRIYQSSLSGRCKKSKNPYKWRPSFLSSEQIREMLEAVDGFLLVTTTEGKIMYISQSVEKFLGHQHIEMIGHSLFLFIHPSDTDMVRAQLQALCLDVGHKNVGANTSVRCSFFCRMRERNQPRSEVLTYQLVHVVGHVTYSNSEESSSSDEEDKLPAASRTNFLLKAFVRIVHTNPYNELSLTDAIQDEYVTRHSLDGTIIFADHRLSTITGHLPHEVYGMSAYEYILGEDIPIALFAHKLMFSHDRGQGLIVYRLRTRIEGFVYLKSTGFLHIEKPSSQVDHFVCVNRLMSDEDGEKELKKFSDHFTPHINGSSTTSLYESIRAVQVSGLPAPASISLMSDVKVSVNGSIPQLLVDDDHSNDKMPVKLEPPDETNCDEKKGMKLKPTGNNLLNSEIPQLQLMLGPYGERTCEKLSLESDNTERLFPESSPLTESSLSANSPQSDDRSMLSPSHATCSSPDMPYSPPSPEQLQQVATTSSSLSNSIEFTHHTPPSGHLSSEDENAQLGASVSELTDRLSPSLTNSPVLMDVDVTSSLYSNWKALTVVNGSLEIGCENGRFSFPTTPSKESDLASPDLDGKNTSSTNC